MRTRVETLFDQVVDLTPEARARFFAEHQIPAETRREVEALLQFDGGSSACLHLEIGRNAAQALTRLEPAGTRCGSYRLDQRLGSGGMGTVYLAERVDGEVAQRVAVKLLRPGFDHPHLRARFLAERQILASLCHPNIARLLDAGHREDGQPYLAMEFVSGEPIDVYAAGLELREKIALFRKVCSAVAYLHRNLVVHRDLKPGNILVTAEGEPKLLDFGIAKMLESAEDTAVTEMRILTPDYASPEQAAGESVTTATDVYSLGAVLYKLLTGQSPHRNDGTSAESAVAAARNRTIVPPAKLAPELKGDLEVILLRALHREPAGRYATVEQFSEDLENYLAFRPIRARNADALYRAGKFLRRYWLPVAALSIALIGLTAGLWIARRERDAAARRFNEVRQLAAQLFVVEHDISTLAGSTKPRERIVKIALEYLERLSHEAAGDIGLQTEIASAYTKVAEIQGGYRATNLGHTDDARASLARAESFFRRICAARPKDTAALHHYLEAVELRSRMEYGQLNRKGIEESLTELQALASRYEPLAPGGLDEWDFLGGIYDTLSLSARWLNRPAQALAFAARSIVYQRKAAAAKPMVRTEGNLAVALGYYSNILRSTGDLDAAIANSEEALRIQERLSIEHPDDNFVRIDLATDYCDLAALYAQENDVSLGNRKEASVWHERALALSREVLHNDPDDNQARHNFANVAWEFADILRHDDPGRALALYDEAIANFRKMPPSAAGRNEMLGIVLAESTFPLRRLHRTAEAAARLEEAKQIAVATAGTAPEQTVMPAEAVARAEADWALASGRPAAAAAAHRAWLDQLHEGAETIQENLQDALIFSAHWQALSEAYRRSGRPELAAEAEEKRRAIRDSWEKKLPPGNRIAWSW